MGWGVCTIVDTFSPFQRNVSPMRSSKRVYFLGPSKTHLITSPVRKKKSPFCKTLRAIFFCVAAEFL